MRFILKCCLLRCDSDSSYELNVEITNSLLTKWELRNESEVGECQGDCLGLYHPTIDTREEGLKEGPVYQQLHDGDNKQYYLFR